MTESDRVRAIVVKLYDSSHTERAWVVATMSEGTWDVIGEEDFQQWKRQALELVLIDWQSYEIREVWLDISQDKLEALFSIDAIEAEVSS